MKENCMLRTVGLVLLFALGTLCASGQTAKNGKTNTHEPAPTLEQVFQQVAAIKGFEEINCSAEEYGYPKEMGTMKMIAIGNADPREAVLARLSRLPSKLKIYEHINPRGKITRWYLEHSANGEASMMYVFVGLGGNDIVFQLFSGSSSRNYQEFAKKLIRESESNSSE